MENNSKRTTIKYATPLDIVDASTCNFYHMMDVPGLGVVGREWDLRDKIDDYLGNYDFQNKRVLDVGTASGYLTFEMEKRGGEVVSFDMESGRQWNVVPHDTLKHEREEMWGRVEVGHQRLQNAYWYAHKAFGSKARVFYGDVYDFPEALGSFDVVLFGMILSHLRDPFQALYSASRLSTDTVIVTNQVRLGSTKADMYFLPTRDNESLQRGWWSFSDKAIVNMLGVLGFYVESIKTVDYKCIAPAPGTRKCTTFIARRYPVKSED